MRIKTNHCDFRREPLKTALGFKGGRLTELWQTLVTLESAAGFQGHGISTQSTLWSDAAVFARNSEAAGNSLMFLLTAHALKLAVGLDWNTPPELLDALLPEVHAYGKKITGNPELRLTFALNALVALDNAAWVLYRAENGSVGFDEMLPAEVRPALAGRQRRLANIPLVSYNVPAAEVVEMLHAGYFLLKIKIGADPDNDGDPEKMLAWDKRRISEIHELARELRTPHTATGRIPYYLDANGRYDSRDRLLRLLEHCGRIGALDQLLLLEEPFPEDCRLDVSGIPARLAADESAHSDLDTRERLALGYTAVALKPVAKTLSMSLRIATVCHKAGIPCFCADLTANPLLLEWNKNVAARLPLLPGMKIGVCEANGRQNYRNWELMQQAHPFHGAPWINPKNGVFELDDEFYACSGGIFLKSAPTAPN